MASRHSSSERARVRKPIRLPASGAAGPDRAAALEQYRRRAGVYDLELALFEPLRREAVRWLGLAPGQTVLDLACGTGLSLPLLAAAVGPRGQVIGVEQSAAMAARARARVRELGLANVTLRLQPVEAASLPARADAALFHLTHDVLQQLPAVAHVLAHLRPGAAVVATGLRWAPRWAVAVNAFVYAAARHSVTTLAGLDRPWRHLEAALGPMELRSRWFGAVYLARGVVPAA